MRSPRILILYNEPVLSADHPDAESEHEILYTVEVVSKTLLQAGFEVARLGASHDPDVLLSGLRAQRPDAVFNLFEGTADDGGNEAYVAGLLEWLGIPFTGSPFHTLTLARHKHLTKDLLKGAGLPTADFMVVEELPVPDCRLAWPVIVKPATQDASVGLDQGSVVTDQQALNARVVQLLKSYGPPVLIEEFIRGREFNVALIEAPELRVLPISEIVFVEKDPSYWPIVTYDAKWKPGSRDYEATPPRYPAKVGPTITKKLTALASRAFRLLGCRDYARVDFRVRPPASPYILEVNPNPDFSPTAGLAGGLASAGLTHANFTVDLVRAALARGKKASSRRVKKSVEPVLRGLRLADREPLLKLMETSGVFNPEEVAAMLERVEQTLVRNERSDFHFIIAERDERVAGFVCYGAVPRTGGAYQVFGLAIVPSAQGTGLGLRLLRAVEARVLTAGGRVLLGETSSQPGHTQARQFFLRQGFRLVGDVPDFYREGDGRLTYAKYLAVPR
jgi:D-alanine-D-alanine ligase